VIVLDEVLKAVLPSVDGDPDKKSGQVDSAVIDQYKKIIREQVHKFILLSVQFSDLLRINSL